MREASDMKKLKKFCTIVMGSHLVGLLHYRHVKQPVYKVSLMYWN